ncbi:MAG: leucine-rich repeat domain-containing protein, partial [Anaeroplasmataceae bacterium]|nr:leucine-rich repeat domain-containing protein [Anaeroplasmataceae bacterium]
FTGCSNLNSVKFSGSCDFIYNNAFSNLPITSFKFPNSKVELEEYVFLGCSKLATIEIAANTEIADNLGSIFQGCPALKTINVDSANQLYSSNGNLLMNKAGDEIILAVSGATYGAYKIPDGVKKIAAGAFSGIQAFTTLDLNQVEEVGKYAFAECSSLTTVTFPQNGIKLGRSAFEACSKLRTLANLNKLTEIADYAFSSIAVSSVELGDNVVVGEGSFGNNSNLKVVNLGSNVTLGFGAFAACGGLTMVNVKGDNLEVGPYAFASCVKLATIDLSKAVGTIGVSAFENCQVLTKADLQNITRVEDFAFADCYKLATVNVPIIEYIGDAAFGAGSENSTSGASFTAIELPACLKHIGEAAFYGCINLKTITIPADCEVLGHAFAYCVSLQSAVIEEGIKELPAYLFGADSALLSVDMKGIEVINEGTFYRCTRLKTIDLSTVKFFGESAFDNCSALTSLDLPEATFLGDGAFFACQNVESISIPKVEYIGEQALSSIKVGSIALPTSLSFVAPTAFYNNEKQTAFVAIVDDNTVDTAVLNDYAQIINGALYTT